MATPRPDASSQPQQWWRILADRSAPLPFGVFFDEVEGAGRCLGGASAANAEENGMPSAAERALLQARVAEPVEGWVAYLERTAAWGEDCRLIEEWFAAGDGHRCATDLVVEEPAPDPLERALGWVRSLAVATRLIPA